MGHKWLHATNDSTHKGHSHSHAPFQPLSPPVYKLTTMPSDVDSDEELQQCMTASSPPCSPFGSSSFVSRKRTMSEAGVGDLPEEGIDQPDSSGDVATIGDQLEGSTNRNLASFATRYAKHRKLRGEQLTDVDNFVKVHTLFSIFTDSEREDRTLWQFDKQSFTSNRK